MSALAQAELAQARADLATMLPDVATLGRYTRTPDGGGGYDETWPVVATGVSCRLSRKSTTGRANALKRAGDRLADETTHTIAFPAGTDVRVKDQVTISGGIYEVLLVDTAGAWELARHVHVKEAL